MKKTSTIIGRILYALPFAVFGINHLIMADYMRNAIPRFILGGVFWIYFTGFALIAAAIGIVFKIKAKLACLLLSLMLLIFILTIHLPGLTHIETMQVAMISLLKDTSLMGAALFIAGTFAKEKTTA